MANEIPSNQRKLEIIKFPSLKVHVRKLWVSAEKNRNLIDIYDALSMRHRSQR